MALLGTQHPPLVNGLWWPRLVKRKCWLLVMKQWGLKCHFGARTTWILYRGKERCMEDLRHMGDIQLQMQSWVQWSWKEKVQTYKASESTRKQLTHGKSATVRPRWQTLWSSNAWQICDSRSCFIKEMELHAEPTCFRVRLLWKALVGREGAQLQ